ncbi:MAG TPA: molybdenum cofactor biosynthesis protein MoaE [Acidimicrobiia bacterium]
MLPPATGRDWIALTNEALPLDAAASWCATPGAGAVVSFTGIVRDHADGRSGVRAMTYEAYEEPARARLAELAAAVRDRWPVVERIALLHRLGDLELSEASVLVVVSTPHRDAAFEAARFAIDELKQTVPIWKKEHWADGADWALGANDVRRISPGQPELSGAAEERRRSEIGAQRNGERSERPNAPGGASRRRAGV